MTGQSPDGTSSTLADEDAVDATAIEYALDESRPHVRTPSEWTWLSERQSGIAMGNNKLVGLPTD